MAAEKKTKPELGETVTMTVLSPFCGLEKGLQRRVVYTDAIRNTEAKKLIKITK
jgi:hypothetical protein